MNTMIYSGAYIQSNDDSNLAFSSGSSYYRCEYNTAPPIFTPQEIYGFEPAQQNIGTTMMDPEHVYLDDNIRWGNQQDMKQSPPQHMYYGHQSVYAETNSMGYTPGFYTEGSQTSPFIISHQSHHSFINRSHPASPVTPTSSPVNRNASRFNQATPSAFLLIPTINNGQYHHFSAFQMPIGPDVSTRSYIDSSTIPNICTSSNPSEYTSTSSISSPEPPALDAEDDPSTILPHSGNTELRGMGLYDTPEPMQTDLDGYSPATPRDRMRPIIGKGLVLEKSFGLPDEIMMKDKTSGRIVKGRIELDDIDIIEEDDLEEHSASLTIC